jgi:hypothetical protein
MIFIFVMISCVESYSPNITKYEEVFVVDGELTNLPGPYVVKLSKSYKLYQKSGDPVNGAHVKIIENTGLEVDLIEEGSGIYTTADNPFRGVVGNSYKLQIKLGNEIYESGFEPLNNPIPIDSVYWEYQVHDNQQDGIQLLLDTHDPTNSTHYYAWYLDETWKFIVPIDVAQHPDWKICYRYNKSTNFNIATSARRNNDIVERHPLIFCNEETNRLYIRYTTMVRQYALTETSYKFLKDIITVNQNQGTLFDPTPSSIIGNIKNIKDKDLPVLGYFLVAGASEKRIFIDRKELPKEYQPTDGFNDCGTQVVLIPIEPVDTKDKYLVDRFKTNPNIVDSLYRMGYTEYERYRVGMGEREDIVYLWQLNLAKTMCYNCTMSGKSEVPVFWTEYPNK